MKCDNMTQQDAPHKDEIRICKTIILRLVLYGCESWSLTLREEQRLRVFENRVLGRARESGIIRYN
jgi:hypothetical protein